MRKSQVERVEKKGKRTYKTSRPRPPIVDLVPLLVETLKSMVGNPLSESPSVTTILGALNKPALIGWAANEERKMVAAFAGHLYSNLYDTIEGKVSPEDFSRMLQEQLGKKAHLKLLEKASNVGTEVHKRIEWEFKGELGLERTEESPVLTSEQATRSFKRWTEWRTQVQLKPLLIEHGLYSALFGFGGTLDLLAEIQVPKYPKLPTEHPNAGDTEPRVVVIDFKTGKSVYGEAFLQNIAYRMALKEEGIDSQGGIIVRLPKYADDPEFDAVQVPDDPFLAPVFIALIVVYKWWEKEHSRKTVDKTKQSVI